LSASNSAGSISLVVEVTVVASLTLLELPDGLLVNLRERYATKAITTRTATIKRERNEKVVCFV
jgi:hypothetical protein